MELNFDDELSRNAISVLLSNEKIGYFWIDCNGIIQGHNNCPFLMHHSFTPDYYIGHHIVEYAGTDSWENCRIVMETGRTQTFEEAGKYNSGEMKWFLCTKSPIFRIVKNKNGENRDEDLIGLSGISIDITDRVLIEEALKDSIKKIDSNQSMHEKLFDVIENSITQKMNSLKKMLEVAMSGYVDCHEQINELKNTLLEKQHNLTLKSHPMLRDVGRDVGR